MTRTFLKFLPAPFWCYMLPMIASTLGWLPKESFVYTFASRQILPVCLVLMLIGTDLKALVRLGPAATRIMLAGATGTIVGGLAAYTLYRKWLPEGSWGAVGALAGSWIGGSANLLAVKEALGVADALVAPIILVDALVAYGWMALLIAASAWEPAWNARINAASSEALRRTLPARPPEAALPRHPAPALTLMLSVGLSLFAQRIAQRLPALPGLTASTWTVMLVTTIALGLSATPLRRLGGEPASSWGKYLLYFLLITIGARADLRAVAQAPVFLAMGITWIAIHGLCLLVTGALWRTPLGLMATASQANIGGVVSAPIVGATYAPELAGIGLLMAVLGNILGTYLGLLTALAARWLG